MKSTRQTITLPLIDERSTSTAQVLKGVRYALLSTILLMIASSNALAQQNGNIEVDTITIGSIHDYGHYVNNTATISGKGDHSLYFDTRRENNPNAGYYFRTGSDKTLLMQLNPGGAQFHVPVIFPSGSTLQADALRISRFTNNAETPGHIIDALRPDGTRSHENFRFLNTFTDNNGGNFQWYLKWDEDQTDGGADAERLMYLDPNGLEVTGDITSTGYFIGDGSQLTGIDASQISGLSNNSSPWSAINSGIKYTGERIVVTPFANDYTNLDDLYRVVTSGALYADYGIAGSNYEIRAWEDDGEVDFNMTVYGERLNLYNSGGYITLDGTETYLSGGINLNGGLNILGTERINASGQFIGDGSQLTNINAANLTDTLPALDGSQLTGITASQISGLENGPWYIDELTQKISYNTGAVGIGITDPNSMLDVVGDIAANEFVLKTDGLLKLKNTQNNIGVRGTDDLLMSRDLATNDAVLITHGANQGEGFAVGPVGQNSSFELSEDHTAYFRGNVGVGTVPNEKLDVDGNVKATAFIGDGSQLTNVNVSALEGDFKPNGNIVVQNGVNGGPTRGIRMWADNNPSWGIYMSTAAPGASMSGGTAPAGHDGLNSHAIRFRAANDITKGFVWENSSDLRLMSLNGSKRSLDVAGEVKGKRLVVGDHRAEESHSADEQSSIIVPGPTSQYSLSVQDGTGRVQQRWNSTAGISPKFITANENASFIDWRVLNGNWLSFKFAKGAGKAAGDPITWENHFTIRDNGNVGIGVPLPNEKLAVDGDIKANSFIGQVYASNIVYDVGYAPNYFDTDNEDELDLTREGTILRSQTTISSTTKTSRLSQATFKQGETEFPSDKVTRAASLAGSGLALNRANGGPVLELAQWNDSNWTTKGTTWTVAGGNSFSISESGDSEPTLRVEQNGEVRVTDHLTVGRNASGTIAGTVAHFDGRVYISEEGGTEAGFDDQTNPNFEDYLLWVEEGIASNDFAIAETTEWPDYVFEEDYEVATVNEVEAFIKTNGHLPNMPSAEEVETMGYTVDDMTKRLVKTVEEMTLQSIEQEKKINTQDALIQSLIKRLEKLETEK